MLPIAKDASVADPDEPSTGQSAGAKRALVVDDEADVAELIAEVLSKDGFEVSIARSGAVALELLRQHQYEVLLSDLNMPGIDGRGLYEHLVREHPDLLARTGFVTGDTMGKASQSLLQESQRPYLEKPVSPDEVRRLVYGMLDGTRKAN